MGLEDNRVFWLFHLGLSVVLPLSWSSPATTIDGYTSATEDGHLLIPVTRKPPLRSKADRHGPEEAAGDQGGTQVSPGDRRIEEASPIQAGNRGAEGLNRA
ncbi:unnamed protein product [Linum trigynum]|uniref:Uncharacterized protein n=1 Tax=Linum trigynum TaxID=586398 RepID=A0AAV2GFQ6_9ROSI